MKQILFRHLNEDSFQVKGCGLNKIYKPHASNGSCPGSFLFTSSSNSTQHRVYCVYSGDLEQWNFPIAPAKDLDLVIGIPWYMEYDQSKAELCLHVPDDTKVTVEGMLTLL